MARRLEKSKATLMAKALISRVIDKYVVMPPQASTRLSLDQHVRIVGSEEEIEKTRTAARSLAKRSSKSHDRLFPPLP